VQAMQTLEEEPAGPFGSREIVALKALWKVRYLFNLSTTITITHFAIVL